MPRRLLSWSLLSILLLSAACGGEPVKLAEKADKLEVKAPPPAPTTMQLVVAEGSGKLGFDMDAPVEKIRGKVPPAALRGEIFLDLADLTKSRGLVHVDLTDLELFQRTVPEGGQEFGEEVKNDNQNEHARQWLEISPDTPPEELQKNVRVEFALARVSDLSGDLSKMTGPERKITFTASGDFLLHQRKAEKSVPLEATFRFDGDALKEVHVKSTAPLSIGLDEYDVRPRTGFGKLAAKTLETLAPKVAKVAEVHLEFTATPAPAGAPAAPAAAPPAY